MGYQQFMITELVLSKFSGV